MKQIFVKKVEITHPDKILFQEQGITKLEIAQYHEKAEQCILPYIINRPLSLLRCPSGNHADCFYQKHLQKGEQSPHLYTIDIPGKHDHQPYIYIKNISGLIKLDQLGVLEIHPWGCKIDKPEKPDQMIFDFDPGPDVLWKEVIASANIVKQELAELDLVSFVKLTGGKGLHVVLPIVRRYSWDEILKFSQIFVDYLSQKYPTQFVNKITKSKRQGKIYVDYLRNHRGATAIAPYSLRAREKAPIAVPVAWDELSASIKPDHYHINNIFARLSRIDDPWGEFFTIKQGLPRV